MTIHFDKIKQAAQPHLEALCFEMFPDGDVQGDQFRIGNIRGERGHKGGSLHVDLDEGWWLDMNPAEGQHGGDIISLWAARYGMNNPDAARDLDAKLSAGAIQANAKGTSQGNRAKSDKNDWVALPFAETEASAPTTKRVQRNGAWAEYPISRSWEYRDAQGRQVGFICRVDFGDGVKDCFPYTFCVNSVTGERKWNWRRFSAPRPLFNLGAFAARPKAGVLIVEGEKKAEIMQREWPDVVVTTWVGGAAAIIYHPEEIDWTPLAGRRVTLWPDADSQCIHDTTELLPALKQPGIAAMVAVEAAIKDIAARTFIVLPPDDWKDGYDLADAIADGWTLERIKAHIKQRRDENTRLGVSVVADLEARASTGRMEAPASVSIEEPEHVAEPPEDLLPVKPEVTEKRQPAFKWPFEFFGTQKTIAFFRLRSNEVCDLDLSKLTGQQLETLAPFEFWYREFPPQAKNGTVNWNAACSRVRDESFARGLYSINRRRGIGFWFDGPDTVMHMGTGLVVNGTSTALRDYHSDFIYDAIAPTSKINFDPSIQPLTAKDSEDGLAGSAKVLDLCKSLEWKDPIMAYFFAGWLALAPICGVLKWRPHVWLSGPAGAGKTSILDNIVSPLLGDGFYSEVQSSTTAAGVMGLCGNNAIPMKFDEAESENAVAQTRMLAVLDVLRACSSESAAPIVKGTPSGGTRETKPRIMFILASIGCAAVQSADISRITRLELKVRTDEENQVKYFGKGGTLDLIRETCIDPNYCAAFRSRSYAFARLSLENIDVFRKVMARKLGDQRQGDQMGTLLAGAWGLRASRSVTEAEAKEWIDGLEWNQYQRVESDKDEMNALSILLATQLRVEDAEAKGRTFSISELIDDSMRGTVIDRNDYRYLALLRSGVKIETDRESVVVSSQATHPFLSKVFAPTPFAGKWKDQFMRLSGAETVTAARFGAISSRATRIPISFFKSGD